jgi:molybdenum cofactor guanylyltransferase
MSERTGGIVLVGGRSTRMGRSKATLEWHGSTLARRVTGIVARAVDGPVVVVRAPGQSLPPLPDAAEIVEDEVEGRGPVQGLATGMAALAGQVDIAYVSSTDVPFVHPAFVRRVIGALGPGVDVVLPEVGGIRQPLAAAYRTALLGSLRELIAEERWRPAFLFERCRVRVIDDGDLLDDSALADADPRLLSVVNVNLPADYETARARPPGPVEVRRFGPLRGANGSDPLTVRAATLGAAAAAAGVELSEHVVAAVNGDQMSRDPEVPLAAGDAVAFLAADGGG